MKEIPLTKGRVALVDDEDFEQLASHEWYAMWNGRRWYAARRERAASRKLVLMHRQILNAPPHLDGDHINLDGLNNQRNNLRLATRQQNGCNRTANKNNRSGCKGVWRERKSGKWLAQIALGGHKKSLGSFANKQDAARAYAEAAAKLHGEFARA